MVDRALAEDVGRGGGDGPASAPGGAEDAPRDQVYPDPSPMSDPQETGVRDPEACVATGVADPYSVIRTQRAALFRELHDLTRRRGAADPATALAAIMLLDRATMHLEADLRWLDMLEARLDAIRRQPLAAPEPRPRGRPPRGQDGAPQ